MDERGIIIADRDAKYRSQLADFFRDAGYRVETTDSTIHALCSILEKQTPVLLLGTDFDHKVSSADLIHLLKKCNRQLHVIMVSDDMPLALARKLRQEGIFYHALKPATEGDTAEIGQAVACAFEAQRPYAPTGPDPCLQGQPQAVSCLEAMETMEADAAAEAVQATEMAEVARVAVSPSFSQGWFKQALPWLCALAGLIFGTSYLSLVAAESTNEGSNLAIWIFLAFCALIVAAQFLPIFRIKLALRTERERQLTKESISGKQQ